VSAWQLYTLSGIAWFAIGLWSVFAHGHWVRKILAANVAGSGLFLIFIAIARRAAAADPDPVPHALVLTGIVVSVSATALALAVARRLAESDEPPEPTEADLEEPPP
jgi:multicomponent Na+:H+ antiporter subunit C